jgi:uncharacterized protein YkwD
MHRVAALLSAVVALSPLIAMASEEDCIQLAYIRPHPPAVVASEERELFDDVNSARARRRLPPLEPDPVLSEFALYVAEDMAERHYFGHTDPEGRTFEDRLRRWRLDYRFACENMAFDQDEQSANAAFLHSPGHYQNIVDPHSRRLGVAVVAAGDGEVFYVEEFSD